MDKNTRNMSDRRSENKTGNVKKNRNRKDTRNCDTKSNNTMATIGTVGAITGITMAVAGAIYLGSRNRKKNTGSRVGNEARLPSEAREARSPVENVDFSSVINSDKMVHIPYKNKILLEKLELKKSRDEREDNESHTCIICFERKRKVILLPCEHMKLCVECSISILNELDDDVKEMECSECRSNVNDLYVAY
jgi:hypothetical protein